MRRIPQIVLLLALATAAMAQPPEPQPVPDRFGIKHKPKTYPQGSPKEVLGAVIEAASTGRADYIVAHLVEPDFINTKIAERARLLEPGIEGELVEIRNVQRQRPFAVAAGERLPDDPRAFRDVVLNRAIDRASRQVMTDVATRIADDPESIKMLRRFYREGTFADADPVSKATLPDVKDHAVYFKKVGDRWFMENRYADVPMAPAP